MGRNTRGQKEFSKEQRLSHENQRLKKQVSSLRKQLAHLDLDRHGYVKEIIEEHYQLEEAQEGQDILEKVQKEWECHECRAGFLEIYVYNKPDGTWYYRLCSNCPHRTASQKYNPGIRGIRKVNEPK